MPDISQMLSNVSELVPAASLLIQVAAGMAGVVIIAQGLHKFVLSTQRGEGQIGSAVMFLISGVALINLALSINVIFDFIYGGSGAAVDQLVAYTPSDALPEQASMAAQVIILLLRLYGLFFTVTGWLALRNIADKRNGSDDGFSKAAFRIIGGAALINIVLTVNFFANLLGFGDVL